jgi:hypothetical protein
MEPTYIVTGRHRTGTSMMMRCLDMASLLKAEHDPANDELMKKLHADPTNYNPNPNGYYLSGLDVRPQDVPGFLIKLSVRNWDWMQTTPGYYKVVWMLRDEIERLQSWNRAFGYEEKPFYTESYPRIEQEVKARLDCEFTYVNYEDVIADPVREFTRIQEGGWPINVEVAAAFVDPSLYRNRVSVKPV